MFEKKRLFVAMKMSDGYGEGEGRDVEEFRALSGLVKRALSPPKEPPAFEFVWQGIERKVEEKREEKVGFLVWLKSLIESKPILTLAPMGTFIMILIFIALLIMIPHKENNECYVDSSDIQRGSVMVDQDLDDPSVPTVIWYIDEG